ncbi:MAG: CoA transferase [Gammaproteobacteria bacterium]|nr:CoA transferase [Gammaproteobacteria bacterium]
MHPPVGALARAGSPRVPGSGESTRGSVAFLARNTNKKSVVIDPDDADDVAVLRGLCARADVVLDADGSPFRALDAGTEAPVAVTVTDPVGLGISSIVGFAASGGLSSSGWPHQPPCNAPSWLPLDGAGVYAAIMAAAGLLRHRRSNRPVRYEIPYHEAATASITPWSRTLVAYDTHAHGQGTLSARLGPGGFPIHEARDGHVRILAATPKQWEALVDLLDRPEELVSGPWGDLAFRIQNFDALKLVCDDLIRQRTVEEVFIGGQQRGLTASPLYTLSDFRDDPHVREREVIAAVEDPEFGIMELIRPPHRLDPTELNVPIEAAPAFGEHDDYARTLLDEPVRTPGPSATEGVADASADERPLAGLRVLQLGVGAVVPEAASVLACLGAEVLKVESRVYPDFLRRAGLGGESDIDNSPTFNQLNLGVESVAIDLSRPEGVELAHRLAAECDVIMENMRTTVVPKWGLDYESARRIRENVVYLSSQGLGKGPYDGFQTFGPNLQTISGVTHQWAHPDDPYPVGTTLNHPDHIAGKQALVAVLGALAQRPAEGCHIDAAQVEAAAYLIGDRYVEQHFSEAEVTGRGNFSPDMAPHGCYRCQDAGDEERWVALAVEDDDQWLKLCSVAGLEALDDPAYREAGGRLDNVAALDEALSAWAAERSVEAAETTLRAAGLPASRAVTGADLGEVESGFFPSVRSPSSGTRHCTGMPVITAAGKRPPVGPSPMIGEHTGRVLFDVLGLEAEEVVRLRDEKIVGY